SARRSAAEAASRRVGRGRPATLRFLLFRVFAFAVVGRTSESVTPAIRRRHADEYRIVAKLDVVERIERGTLTTARTAATASTSEPNSLPARRDLRRQARRTREHPRRRRKMIGGDAKS